MTLRQDELIALLRLLAMTANEEIDCTEFLARVAGYVERLAHRSPTPQDATLLQHLAVCPECREELDALRDGLLGFEP